MLDFLTNNKEYEVQANNQLSSILGYFDIDYTLSIVEDTLNEMYNRFDLASRPNIVSGFEDIFKYKLAGYKEIWDTFEKNNFYQTRSDIYTAIIRLICARYNLNFNNDQELDENQLYSLTYYMYDLFVSRFDYYLVSFFARMINNEKDELYERFHLDELKKNKDTSTLYSKMVFNNNDKLSIISANLPMIISGLSYLDIPDRKVLTYIYPDNPDAVNMLEMFITPQISYFTMFSSLLNVEQLKYDILIQVRLKLQIEYLDLMPEAQQLKKGDDVK